MGQAPRFFTNLQYYRTEESRDFMEGNANEPRPMAVIATPASTKVVVIPTFSAKKPVPSKPMAEGIRLRLKNTDNTLPDRKSVV